MKAKQLILAAVLCAMLPLAHATGQPSPQDIVTVGSATAAAGTTITVPVYIRDTSGTPLGIDQPPGNRIQAYSLTVNYAPAADVQSITFTRAGITAPLTPSFENSPSSPGTISLIDTFHESTNLIPFTLDKAAPGDLVGNLTITTSPAAIAGPLTLTLDPTLTQLGNEAGTIKETTTLGTLLLVSGTVTVLPFGASNLPTLSYAMLALLIVALGIVAIRMRL